MLKFVFGLFLTGSLAHAADPASVHGMLIFGESKLYLNHLPMFHRPHDYQVIFEATLDKAAEKTFRDDRKAHPNEKVYTIVPEKFVLPTQVAALTSFKADLFRGHFERGGTQIASDVTVELPNLVYFRKFDPAAGPSEKGSYFVFGSGKDVYAAHWIRSAPDFDRILSVKIDNSGKIVEGTEIYHETSDLKD